MFFFPRNMTSKAFVRAKPPALLLLCALVLKQVKHRKSYQTRPVGARFRSSTGQKCLGSKRATPLPGGGRVLFTLLECT